jgi:sugar phosphate isomerase/epimerase
MHYDRAAEALRHCGKRAQALGIRIVVEVHMNTIHDTIASTAKLLDKVGLDNVLANPVPGNMFSTSTAEKSPESLDLLEGRIGYVHLKNCVRHGDVYDYGVHLANGHIDLFRWIDKLYRAGYSGPVCVEYCGDGDPHPAAEADIHYIRHCQDLLRDN